MARNGMSTAEMVAVMVVMAATCTHAACPFSSAQALGTNATWLGQIPAATNASDPLVRLNNFFHGIYDQSGRAVLPQTLVFQEGDYLVLLRGDTQGNFIRNRTAPILPRLYHDLKMVAHIPLTVFVLLWPYIADVSSYPYNALISYRGYLLSTVPAIQDGRFSDANMLDRQMAIVNRAISFVTQAEDKGSMTLDDLKQYVQGEVANINQNLADAAKAQIDQLLSVMNDWRQNVLSKDEWQGLRFASGTDHMARTMSLVSQVFARILSDNPSKPTIDPDSPNSRFIVAENPSDEDEVIASLSRHIIDYAAGNVFFQDTYRLHRDALADAAQAYLDQIFGPGDK